MSGILECAQNYFWNSFWKLVDVKEGKRVVNVAQHRFSETLFVPSIEEKSHFGVSEEMLGGFVLRIQNLLVDKTLAHLYTGGWSSGWSWTLTYPKEALQEIFSACIQQGDATIFALAQYEFVFLEPGKDYFVPRITFSCKEQLEALLEKRLVNSNTTNTIEIDLKSIKNRSTTGRLKKIYY